MREFVVLRRLAEPSAGQLDSTFNKLAEFLADAGEKGDLLFRLVGDGPRQYSVSLGKDKPTVGRKADHPALEVVVTAQVWQQIAAAEISPLTALIEGKLRVRGDLELGKRLLRHLAGSEGRVEICEVR
jgi:putative sterol carrier protein